MIRIGVCLDPQNKPEYPNRRDHKGKSLLKFLDNYTVIDIETTGFDSIFDEIIEIGAIKVRNNHIIDKFNELINIGHSLPSFISQLTGINDEMLANGISLESALSKFLKFIDNDILVGHNINFDINFLYDKMSATLKTPLKNDFVDTLRLSKRVIKDLQHYRLIDLIEFFKINNKRFHRGPEDCHSTFEIYNKLKDYTISNNLIEALDTIKKHKLQSKDIVRNENIDINTNSLIYDKIFVFTGTLSIPRKEAMQLVIDNGGKNSDGINKNVDYLVMGNFDYRVGDDQKSTKQVKAENLILKGQDIQIITENVFFDLINSCDEN